MRKLLAFKAMGLAVVPWSVPDIGVATAAGGRRVRFARRGKKSRLAEGKASLEDWQRFVADAGREALGDSGVYAGPIKLHIDFYARTPKGRRHGELWAVDVRWDESKGAWSKRTVKGGNDPDLTNMFKGTEDAIAGVLFANDVQCRITSAAAWFGPADGVTVTIYAIEPGDFPGRGEPV